ncbi:MAG TPA: FkbM family methyltransferase [Verrucomicrobiae bacterium]|nr:FkbM family methyltransferase [Verrucomicrobiae bacterium]
MHIRAAASRATSLLAKNPALFWRVAVAKVSSARPLPPLPARKAIGSVQFEYDLVDYRGTAPMYFGSYALLVVEAIRRFLRPGGVFFDVGANIGYLSAVAADRVGPLGQVHAFEPVARYFSRLQSLAAGNPQFTIIPNFCAAAEFPGTSRIFLTREPGQNTLVAGYKSGAEVTGVAPVAAIRLDSYIEEKGIAEISMIKIDAEGFELPILRGLERYFRSTRHRPVILTEIAPRAYPLLGKRLHELRDYMARFGYSAFDLIDARTPVDVTALRTVDDVLFLPRGFRR